MRDYGFKEGIMTSVVDEDVEFLPMMSFDEDEEGLKAEVPDVLPILPLRNTVLFPGVVLPITVGRDKTIKAVADTFRGKKLIGVLAQRDADNEDPELEHLYPVGTVARIVKQLRMPDGSTTIIIQGKGRFTAGEVVTTDPYLQTKATLLKESELPDETSFEAIISSIRDLANDIIQQSPNIPSEAAIVLKNIDSPAFLIHFVASNLQIGVVEKQQLLEAPGLLQRAEVVLKFLQSELKMLELKNQIQDRVKMDIDKQQREYFLSQQLKQIQEELGGSPGEAEISRFMDRANRKKWNAKVREAFDKEIEKLRRIHPNAAEYSVITNYIDLLLELPWEEFTTDNFNIKHAREILDEDHYGLDKIKDRLLEYLAVLKLKGDMKSPILCLVGPPGVGKTSLGQSVARALGRKYVRMSLGGLHDESEIRGHRKTYIGAMPGRILQSLKRAKSSNPVFILDEVDKVGSDFRGDPSSALLEVLDPEQNTTFYDNFLELEYDLSKVLFIATANNLNTIQPALRDRMEIIYLSGYSAEEKIEIAKRHLVPRQRTEHGLKSREVILKDEVLRMLIEHYTRESGVRELERVIASVMRRVARYVAEGEMYNKTIRKEELKDILGAPRFMKEDAAQLDSPGVAIGLAWTSVGGDILYIETSKSAGKGGLQLTGNLGNVMKESASTALSYIRANAKTIGIPEDVFEKSSLHIHVPEGAIPKDGPSAGITMLTSLTSALTGRKVKSGYAMTGEITLRGKVLPVGGIKEKILAARRAGLKHIILCKANEKDIAEIPAAYLKGMRFHYVSDMSEVLGLALMKR